MVVRTVDDDRSRFYCWLFCVLVVLSVACLLSWLSLTPKNPRFQISDTQLLPFDSNFNQSGKYLMFNLEVSNPNKRMGIYYSGITLNLYEGGCVDDVVAGTNSSTPSFYQGYKNTTSLHILIHACQRGGSPCSGGNTEYIVGVQTYVRFRILRWKTKLRQIEHRSIFHAPEHEAGEVQAQAPAPASTGVEMKASSN